MQKRPEFEFRKELTLKLNGWQEAGSSVGSVVPEFKSCQPGGTTNEWVLLPALARAERRFSCSAGKAALVCNCPPFANSLQETDSSLELSIIFLLGGLLED